MTPTRLFEIACEDSKDIFDLKEAVDTYKRLDSGAIEMVLKNGKKAVFRIDPRSKKRFLMFEWR
jgi:hypothetical protein